jgi:hypothetical protein
MGSFAGCERRKFDVCVAGVTVVTRVSFDILTSRRHRSLIFVSVDRQSTALPYCHRSFGHQIGISFAPTAGSSAPTPPPILRHSLSIDIN